MVCCDLFSSININSCTYSVFRFYHTFCNLHSVSVKIINFECIQNFCFKVLTFNHTAITNLTAAFCVERRCIKNNINYFAFISRFDFLSIFNKCNNFSFCTSFVITYKVSFAFFFFDIDINQIVCQNNFLSGSFSTFFLFFHTSFKAFFVNSYAFFLSNFYSQFKRETVCIIQFESVFSANFIRTVSKKVIEKFLTSIECLFEFFFFFFDNGFNFFSVFIKLRIS